MTLEEIQQSTRVDDDEGGGVGGDCRRLSVHWSRDKHGQVGEVGVSVGIGDGAIGLRRKEHPRGDDEGGGAIASMGAGRNTFGTCFGETGLKIRPDVFRHDNCEQKKHVLL